MRLGGRGGGQAAMVDAILFMTIMLVACAVVVGSSGAARSDGREALQRYAADYADALLASELSGLEYANATGSNISAAASGLCVAQLLCDEALVLENASGCDFSGYNARILTAARALLRPGLDCAVSCGPAFISGLGDAGMLPADRCASRMTVIPGSGDALDITVYVWVV